MRGILTVDQLLQLKAGLSISLSWWNGVRY